MFLFSNQRMQQFDFKRFAWCLFLHPFFLLFPKMNMKLFFNDFILLRKSYMSYQVYCITHIVYELPSSYFKGRTPRPRNVIGSMCVIQCFQKLPEIKLHSVEYVKYCFMCLWIGECGEVVCIVGLVGQGEKLQNN